MLLLWLRLWSWREGWGKLIDPLLMILFPALLDLLGTHRTIERQSSQSSPSSRSENLSDYSHSARGYDPGTVFLVLLKAGKYPQEASGGHCEPA